MNYTNNNATPKNFGTCNVKSIAANMSVKSGTVLRTFEIELPRIVLAEFNTHNAVSKNTSSSRAIPNAAIIEQLEKNLFVPEYWGKNQAGMKAKEELDEEAKVKAYDIWLDCGRSVIESTKKLQALNLHKQLSNRISECFHYVKICASATEWNNMLHLRNHEDAQPEIHDCARGIAHLIDTVTPNVLKPGEWHLPYYYDGTWRDDGDGLDNMGNSLNDARMISVSCTAQTSYRKNDDTVEKAQKLFNIFFDTTHIHACYDDQTEVFTNKGWQLFKDVSKEDKIAAVDYKNGSMTFETAPVLVYDYSGEMVKGSNDNIDFLVTPNHRMLVQTRSTQRINGKRKTVYASRKIIEASELSDVQTRYIARAKLETDSNIGTYQRGQLDGFILGDGYSNSENYVQFHLSKKRKIEFIETVLSENGIEFTTTKDVYHKNPKTVFVKFNRTGVCEKVSSCTEKTTGDILSMSMDYIQGVFDGLMESDGSKHHSGAYTFATTSKQLAIDVANIATALGMESNTRVNKETGNRNDCYCIYIRKAQNTHQKTTRGIQREFYDGKVYCSTVSTGMLLVRRNGRQMVCGNSPAEHQGTPLEQPKYHDNVVFFNQFTGGNEGATHIDRFGDIWSGNFKHWSQYRQVIPGNVVRG